MDDKSLYLLQPLRNEMHKHFDENFRRLLLVEVHPLIRNRNKQLNDEEHE